MANNAQYPGIQPPRPPVAAMGPPPNAYPSIAMQFLPAGPPRPPAAYMPMVSQQFLGVGRPNMVPQPMQHLPTRPGPPAPPLTHNIVPPPPPPPAAQAFPVPEVQPSRPVLSVSPQAQPAVQVPINFGPGQSGPRVALPLTYSLSTPVTTQVHVNGEVTSQYQPISSINMPSFPPGGPAVTPMMQLAEQTSVASSIPVITDLHKAVEKAASDWIEHTSHKGKRYYYNKKTKISSWEKPLELMNPIERADASTNWKEYPAPDGRKYYYNKVTKLSKWKIPDELKLAREQVITKCTTNEQQSTKDLNNESSVPSVTPGLDSPSSQAREPGSSPVAVAHLIPALQSGSVLTSELSTGSIESSKVTAAEETPVPAENVSAKDAVIVENSNIEESNRGIVTNDSDNVAAIEEKTVDQEIQVYETKQDAKNAFKTLLESANVASDWTWDQAMRVIINDRRYGALRSLAERKQAFNEFLIQKKKLEAEQRRAKHKKAREEFKKMLEESKDITVSTKWSKAVAIFEDDDRFKAVERSKDREDLYDDYITEREKKERSKALEEHKKNKREYIEFLKSCDFLTASSQWRKVQDRLEADESCLRLEKVDRLEIFQEYIRDLEKDEEEQRKLRTEEIRKSERKNRDEFRNLMDEHINSGMLTSKSHWRDYCTKVKDLPAYLAVSSNSSGATPKDLFEDVIEELEKQYTEDKDLIKEIVKMRKVSILSTWTLEDFKNTIAEDIGSQPVSDVNLKLVFDELLERARDREEKEAKRRKRVVDDFYTSLTTSKEITSSSRWDDFKPLFEDRIESWFSVEESSFRETFDKYIAELKKARDERKHREDKAKDRERRRRDKDKKGKNNKRRRDEAKDSHRHSAERKKMKQLEQQSSASVEYESRHKRYKRDHRRGDYDDQREAEDGEVW